MADHVDLHNEPCHGGTVPSASKPRVAATTQKLMKTISRLMAAFAAAFIMLFAVAPQGFAQGKLVYKWVQNEGDNTGSFLVTPTGSHGVSAPTALAEFTSYSICLISSGGVASVSGQNIEPLGPGGATSYTASVPISEVGTMLRIRAWVNPSGQLLSAESVSNIRVNGLPISSVAVSANLMTPTAMFEYNSPVPIQRVDVESKIWAVSGTSETGMSIEVLSVPEPSSAALLGLSVATLLIFRRKK